MAQIEQIEDWLAKTALRDRAAFNLLYQATSAKLFGVTLRVLGNRAAAEEVLQETYVRIWQKAGQYKVNGLSPMTWLITVARNNAIDRKRKQKTPTEEIPVTLSDGQPGPEAAAIASQDRDRLMACFAELPEGRAGAVKSAYLDGTTYADLAAHYDVPLNTMRTWLRRSLIALKECMSR